MTFSLKDPPAPPFPSANLGDTPMDRPISAKLRDPVCWTSVSPAEVRAERQHGTKTYYFCCRYCAERFDGEPEWYGREPLPRT
jgi:YHS domain-containing protein